jgi:hypothetical protein
MMEDKIQCTNCKCHRIETDFIGKSGNRVKRCLKCREKDANQKKRPDVMERRNERQREKKYYVEHRKKKREENEEEYLKNNAEIMKIWRQNNKQHLSEYRTQNFNRRFYCLKRNAQTRGIIWDKDLTDELCYKMMSSNCFYCDLVPDKSLNGLDRMDNSIGYEKKNTVGCCAKCNLIKGSLDPETFIKRCQHISKNFGGGGNLNKDIWSDSKSSTYNEYLQRAMKKELEFELTKEQFSKLVNDKCYYCNKENSDSHRNGIDRKNNNLGYIIDNCTSCCGQCNQMKAALSAEDYIEICKRVAEYSINNYIEIPKINKCEYRIAKREKHVILKEKIIITKQQFKEKLVKAPVEKYIPKQRVYTRGSSLPEDCSIKAEDIPEYCYYTKASTTRGDAFCCSRTHPKQKEIGKDWSSSTSKKVSTEEKYKQLMDYLAQ